MNRSLKPGRSGELLAGAVGYRVLALDGRRLGVVEHLRYGREVDRPEEVVLRERGLLRRRRCSIPVEAIVAVSPSERTVSLRVNPAIVRPARGGQSAATSASLRAPIDS